MVVQVFTFLTDKSRVQYLEESSIHNGMKITYIFKEKWSGYVDKIFSMKTALESLADDDIVCFIDAYDVLVNSTVDNMVTRFLSYDTDLVIGAELNCYPECYKSKFDIYASSTSIPTLYKYINSGGYIGYVHAINKIFNWKQPAEIYTICKFGGDQAYFIEYFLQNHHLERIKLDFKCILFQNMHLVSWDEIKFSGGAVKNTILNNTPVFIHFNGGVWQTASRENIMPHFVRKMKDVAESDLSEFVQLKTITCFPHAQLP